MRLTFLGILVVLLAGCQDQAATQDHEQAFEIHQTALITFDSLAKELNTLISDSLQPGQFQEWQQLQNAGAEWERNLVEVPGFEHDHHDHGAGHHHDHGSDHLNELPAKEMLALQQALLAEVQKLLGEARRLTAIVSSP